MKRSKAVLVALMFSWLITSGMVAQAQIIDTGGIKFPDGKDPRSVCVIPKVDGERVPFPLRNANTKFELAENETYILNGTIINQNGKAFFQVDFNSQPWLATAKRTQFPYFGISDGDTSLVKKFNGALVQMAVVVRKQDVSTNGKEWNNGLLLDVITVPQVISR